MIENALLKQKKKPHYAGHRNRLRERFLKGGREALAEYELLELLLFMAIPRKDVKPLAKELIKTFGSFSGVIHAQPDTLKQTAQLTDSSIIALKIIKAASFELMKQDLINKPVLSNWQHLLDYLQATMAHEKREMLRLLFLNKKNELIADEIQQTGTIDHTHVYVREVIGRALELGATALILVHNHPSGRSEPSPDDVEMTNDVIDAAKPLNIKIHDHVIISKNGYYSFKNDGMI